MLTETYIPKHNTFGGLIYESDFNTEEKSNNYNGSQIAERIISDYAFDLQCLRNIEFREREEEYANRSQG